MTASSPPEAALRHLLLVMAKLRDPVSGCPWDQVQDFSSIAPYTVEEAHEVAEAIRAGPDFPALLDELGDLLFQAVYHARMAEEAGRFDFAAVTRAITAKMVRRHPHAFRDAPPRRAGAPAPAAGRPPRRCPARSRPRWCGATRTFSATPRPVVRRRRRTRGKRKRRPSEPLRRRKAGLWPAWRPDRESGS